MVSVAFGIICNNARVTAGIAASVISGLDCQRGNYHGISGGSPLRTSKSGVSMS
jgi:hypothetical protein